MKQRRTTAWIALLAIFLLPFPAVANETGYVFDQVRVLSMTSGASKAAEVIGPTRVVITGDRIVAVGTTGKEPPSSHRVIDARGKVLMPGLADMHVHYWREDLGPVFLANGITTVRNLWGTLQSVRLDDGARRHAFAGPHVYSSGPLMDGPEPIWGDESIVLTDAAQAVGAVESQKKSGYMAVKLYEGLTPEIFRAAVKAAKERDMQVWAHTPHGLDVNDLIELRIDSLEHFNDIQELLRGDAPVSSWFEEWAQADEGKMKALSQKFADAQVWNSPTLSVIAERYRFGANPDAFFARPEAAYLPDSLKSWWQESAGRMKPYDDTARAARDRQLQLLKTLFDANAPLLLGTDTPNPFVLPGFSIHGEIAAWVEAGIPLEQVLYIATFEAARFLGEEGQWGVIAEDARADLLLLDGNPIEDRELLRKPAGVMMNGRWMDREDLQDALTNSTEQLRDTPTE